MHTLKLRRALRQSRAAVRLLSANLHRLDEPVKLNLCVTYWCQYRCKTCNIWQRQPRDELSTDELLRFVSKNDQVSWLDLTGGEIFLREDIGDILEAIVGTWKHLSLLHFPTNGFLTDKIVGTARRIAGKSPAEVIITVSLDGDEELNDTVRGIKGGYRRQIETFNALRRISGVRVVFGMTVSAFNVGHFESTFQACQRDCDGLDIQDFHLNVAQQSAHYYGNQENSDVIAPPSLVQEELSRYRERRGAPSSVSDWVEHTYLRHLQSFLATGLTPMKCHALRSSCFIDPWGVVFPCITYSRPVGQLRETDMSLAPIWQGHRAVQTQSEIWDYQCPQCWTSCEAYQSILGNLARGDRAKRSVDRGSRSR